jgi:hypothetical protein
LEKTGIVFYYLGLNYLKKYEFYNKNNDFLLSENYFLKSVEKNYLYSLDKLSKLYLKYYNNNLNLNYLKKSKTCLLESLEKGILESYYRIGKYYYLKENYIKSEQYYLMGVEKEKFISLNKIAWFYYKRNSLLLSEEYFLKSIKTGNIDSIFDISKFYYNTFQFEKFEKYIKLSIENKIYDAITLLGEYTHRIKKYQLNDTPLYYLAYKYYGFLHIDNFPNRSIHGKRKIKKGLILIPEIIKEVEKQKHLILQEFLIFDCLLIFYPWDYY